MTKEEAISKVEGYLADDFPIEDYGEVEEIIKVLEKKPCIDVVSRQAVLNTLDFADKALDEDRTVETYKELLIACYKDLPSVKHTQKLGRWIFVDNAHEHAHYSAGEGSNTHECPSCGFVLQLMEGTPEENLYNYCPRCGKKLMQQSEEGAVYEQDNL